jgi:hypothetical protein
MTAVRRARFEPAAAKRANAVPPHEARDAATACRSTFRAERGMHPRATVTTAVLGMEASDITEQPAIGDGPRAFRAISPRIIAAGRNFENPAHQPNRPGAGVIADEFEGHLGISAKMPIAFMGWPAPYAPAL